MVATLGRRAQLGPSLFGLSFTQRRGLHLAPPFLLDDYVPRYQMLSEVDAAKKRSLAYAHLRNCNLCPRLCGVNRYETTGMCLIGDNVKVNVIAPHFGEGRATPFPSVLSAPIHLSLLPIARVSRRNN
jgi:hypothetical protein